MFVLFCGVCCAPLAAAASFSLLATNIVDVLVILIGDYD